MIKLSKPLLFFDLETTGLNSDLDSIIEVAASIQSSESPMVTQKEWLIKPRRPISQEIAELTGITNEMVADKPEFHAVAQSIHDFFLGCDLAGYNIIRFDVPFLQKELMRCGFDLRISDRKLLDVQKIYHKKEGRRLEDAVRLYCGREHDGAHRAIVDVRATIEVLDGQIKKYGIEDPVTVDQLITFQSPDPDSMKVDAEGKLFWRDGKATFSFGKYISWSLEDVVREDPGYMRWASNPERDFSEELKVIFRKAIGREFPKKAEVSNA